MRIKYDKIYVMWSSKNNTIDNKLITVITYFSSGYTFSRYHLNGLHCSLSRSSNRLRKLKSETLKSNNQPSLHNKHST